MTYKHPKKPNDNLLANLLNAVGSLQAKLSSSRALDDITGFKIKNVMKMERFNLQM